MPRKSPHDLPFPDGKAERLKPPPDLIGPAREAFVDVVLGCRVDHFQTSDMPLLVRYARALVAEKLAADELELEPVVDGRPSPWLAIWTARIRACTTLARMLRVNPAGRQSMPASPKEPPLPVSVYERMALEAARDERN
jgi:hypothetical protein